MSTPTATPRTDALILAPNGNYFSASATDYRNLARTLETELATERARLDWLEAHALPQHSPNISISDLGRHYNGFPGSFRAAIDAAMEEGTFT